ncbi:unnamed protein product [Cyprideis torosa]|uniref:Uncharacterized protein n=1 Tax=Cyprideis torosa TaxID=163714 RepID=A0A7R8WPZ5_9CRUS|nr:unnamed protein product [Cyprideis torosa]CAG0907339.1 unnamed protein product [Cyprideis torosa]
MDVLGVREGTRFAMEFCRSGKGPIIIESATYRYSGHSMSDPGTSYRTREEIQEVRQTRDPITSFKEKIVNAGLTTPEELKSIDQSVRKAVDEATKAAKNDKEIDVAELYADVYSNPLEETIRSVHHDERHPHLRIGKAWNM